jgi:CBS domain-containing protein
VIGLLKTKEEQTKRLKVKDVMTKEPFLVDAEHTIKEAAIAMDRAGRGCLLVTSKGKVVGIVTERDLVRRALTKGSGLSRLKVKSIMSSPLIIIKPDVRIEDAAKVMSDNKIRRLPVVGEDGLAGVITVTDIARSLAEQQQFSDTLLNAMARADDMQNAIYA